MNSNNSKLAIVWVSLQLYVLANICGWHGDVRQPRSHLIQLLLFRKGLGCGKPQCHGCAATIDAQHEAI